MANTKNPTRINPHTQAQVLSQALPFFQRYSGETIVIKYGGHAMVNHTLANYFSGDIVLLRQLGINPIVVHGGGPQIAESLAKAKIKSSFIDGLRVTDDKTIKVVEHVLAKTINKSVTDSIKMAGGEAIGLSGKNDNLIQASKLKKVIKDRNTNSKKLAELGYVGQPRKINVRLLRKFKKSLTTPVIAPLAVGNNNETYNVNADTAAGAIATALKATRLLLLTDVAGIKGRDGKLIKNIDTQKASELIEEGTITGGMIPKIETCLQAAKNNVEAAVIIDGRVPHAILLELFTDHGVGTLISKK